MHSVPDRLEAMFIAQERLQFQHNGYELEDQTNEQRIDNVRINVLAAIKELTEVLDECGWKPWAKSRHFDVEHMQQELIDVWCFVMNLMLHAGMSSSDMSDLYATKFEINLDRATNGYEGFKTKPGGYVDAQPICPQCLRDLVLSPPNVVRAGSTDREDLHCVCGAYLGSRAV